MSTISVIRLHALLRGSVTDLLNSQFNARVLGDKHAGLHVLLPVLAHLSSRNMAANPQSVRREMCRLQYTHVLGMARRHLFTLKAIIVPIAGITFFIWCIVKAHGVGPIVHQPAQIHGSELGWGIVVSVMSCMSNMITLVTCV